ncbi:MAG: LytTR family DNA-binding domain-containing protein [Flavobacteriaceae bacterium]
MRQQLAFINSSRYKLVLSLAYGLFLYLFLIAFLPFGVSNYDPQHEYTFEFLKEMAIFVPVTIIASLINEFGIRAFLKNRANFRFFIGWTIWSLVLIGLIIFVTYNFLGNWHDWKMQSVPGFVFNTATVLIFPAVGVFFFFRHSALRQNYDAILTNADSSFDQNLMIQFSGEGVKDNISIALADFIYARAQDNYIELIYLKNNILSRFLIRSSLNKFVKTLQYDFLVRCHRSYLINLYNVHSIKGGRQNLRIFMDHKDVVIPVSKTYIDNTMESLRKYKRFQ